MASWAAEYRLPPEFAGVIEMKMQVGASSTEYSMLISLANPAGEPRRTSSQLSNDLDESRDFSKHRQGLM